MIITARRLTGRRNANGSWSARGANCASVCDALLVDAWRRSA
jgi:hypothetical protein